jgi:hypothetical protein
VNELRRLFAPDEGRDMLRALGGLLLGTALLLWFIRKSSTDLGEPWGDFALLVVLLVPCAFLYAIGLLGRFSTGALAPWASVYLVFALVFVPLVLFQFVELVDGDTGAPLNVFWIFLVTAAAAGAAALLAGVRYQLLLGSIALIVSWSALWDEIIGLGDSLGTYRGLLIILSALLLGGAVGLYLLDREGGLGRPSELVTGAGISAVTGAGGISFLVVFSEATLTGLPVARPSTLWNLVLLVVALLLILGGTRFGFRGPAYVGAIGLFIFVFVVGLDFRSDDPDNSLVGWPLVLLILGAIAFAVSMIPGLKIDVPLGRRGGPPSPGPPSPPPPSPGRPPPGPPPPGPPPPSG